MKITKDIKKYKMRIILCCVILFVVGYMVGTIMGYIAWKEYVDNTVDFLSHLQILGKGNYDINEVKNQINKVYEVHNKGEYFKTVEELKKLEEVYPNLQVEPEFQRLMKKIK